MTVVAWFLTIHILFNHVQRNDVIDLEGWELFWLLLVLNGELRSGWRWGLVTRCGGDDGDDDAIILALDTIITHDGIVKIDDANNIVIVVM